MAGRIHNFNPGPAALPLGVLEEARDEFLDFKGSGMSVTEISHRSALFEEVLNDAVGRVTRLLKLPDDPSDNMHRAQRRQEQQRRRSEQRKDLALVGIRGIDGSGPRLDRTLWADPV